RYTLERPGGDRGGNLFELKVPPDLSDGYPPDNLHAYWDGTAGLFPWIPPSGAWREKVPALAERVRAATPSPQGIEGDLDPESWARESYRLAAETVYQGVEEGTWPDEAYRTRAQSVIEQRLALAGYRLGALLEFAVGAGGAGAEGPARP
ncbi:MAG: hypothetical protein KDD47_06525, partial [Acidobacteria bacterium]|nr:hypothetical protein [Acidobacteriota bacterium]